MASISRSPASAQTRGHSQVSPDKFNFIYVWAFIGLLFAILTASILTAWVTGPHFVPVPIGPDKPPMATLAMAWFLQILTPSLFLIIAYRVVYKPWRRDGKLSFDGMIVIASLSMYWQNTVGNYFVSTVVLLNSVYLNWGSFYMYIPGWVSPDMNKVAESPLAWYFCYATWAVFLPMIVGAKVMRMIKQRYPHFTGWQLFCSMVPLCMLLDFGMERLFIYCEAYAYATTIPELTLWAGKTYQFPVYEIVGWGLCLSIYTSFYYFRDDKGYTFVDRGVQQLRVGERTKTILRILSITAFLNLVFLIFSSMPVVIGGTLGGPMAKGYPSYMNTGLCGPDTNYDCPGPGIPIPRRDSPTNRVGSVLIK